MVQRFWKIFGWVCCILTVLLFAAGWILCAGPAGAIQPEWFLHPVYGPSQWEVLTSGGETLSGPGYFVQICTFALDFVLLAALGICLVIRLSWREIPLRYALTLLAAGLILGCGLLYCNYHAVWYQTYMLLSFPLSLALVWLLYALLVRFSAQVAKTNGRLQK